MILTVSKDGVLVPAAFSCLGLVGQYHPGFNRSFCRLVVKPLDNGEDKSADLGKQTAVVAEVGPQDTRYRENELPMGQTQ